MELAQRVRALAAPLAEATDVDLVDVLIRGEGRRRVVRVIVDRKGGVDVERCTELSRELGDELEALSELDAGYALEVTSPGIDYPLRDQRAFDRVEGRAVLVHRRESDGRVVQVRGVVRAALADQVLLEVDGRELTIAYGEVEKATQVLPW